MFKRFKTWLRGERSKQSAPPPPVEYDLSKPFRIVVPTVVEVPLAPLETFSSRARELLLAELEDLKARTSRAMFHPLPNGTLKVFLPPEGEKETVN